MAKGPSTPIISTLASQRDGTRNTSPGGYQDDPRFEGATYPPRVLGVNGGGTADPKFNISSFNYLGAFKVRSSVGKDKNFRAVAFNPPNGSNGVNGSLFMSGKPAGFYEYEIPTNLSQGVENWGALPNATRLQSADFTPIDLRVDENPFSLHDLVGWIRVIDGKLYVQTLHSYQASNFSEHITIFDSTQDIQGQITAASYTGPLRAEFEDKTSRYMAELPEPWASTFGKTHFAGIYNEVSIISRASLGPSFYTFSPGLITPTTDPVDFDQYAQYSDQTGIAGFNKSNTLTKEYYEGLVDMAIQTWAKLDIALTNPEPENNRSTATDVQYRVTTITVLNTSGPITIPTSFIIQDTGVENSSLVVKSNDGLTTYTEGVDYEISFFNYQKDAQFTDVLGNTEVIPGEADLTSYAKPLVTILGGGAISDNDIVKVSYTYLTARYADLTYYPSPASTLGAQHGTYICGSGCAFVPTGTDTLVLIGKNGGMRYGTAYKSFNFDDNTSTAPGESPVDNRDFDNWIWLLNLNDIYNAVDVEDPEFYYSGVFDSNKWKIQGIGAQGSIQGGCYDRDTNRLYLTMGFPEFGLQAGADTVIAVYEIN
jgi:hypothetical protein